MGAKPEYFWFLAYSRRWFPGVVLVGSKSGRFGGSLRREFDFRESAVGGRKVTAFWWLAMVRKLLSGVGCRWKRSHMVANFGEKMIFGTRVLVGAKSQCLGERAASTLFLLIM